MRTQSLFHGLFRLYTLRLTASLSSSMVSLYQAVTAPDGLVYCGLTWCTVIFLCCCCVFFILGHTFFYSKVITSG